MSYSADAGRAGRVARHRDRPAAGGREPAAARRAHAAGRRARSRAEVDPAARGGDDAPQRSLAELAAEAEAKVGQRVRVDLRGPPPDGRGPDAARRRSSESIRDEPINAEWALEAVVQKLLGQFESSATSTCASAESIFSTSRRSCSGLCRAAPRPAGSVSATGRQRSWSPTTSRRPRPSSSRPGPWAGSSPRPAASTSHTTIIAKSLGIPAVVGRRGTVVPRDEGASLIIVDGFEGHVIVDPDQALVQVYPCAPRSTSSARRSCSTVADLPAVDSGRAQASRCSPTSTCSTRSTAAKAGGAGRASGSSAASSSSCRRARTCPTRSEQTDGLPAAPGRVSRTSR